MSGVRDRDAIVYCEGAFATPNGKTAHGLVRRTARYRILSVVDSRHAGKDAGWVLDRRNRHIPIHGDIEEAYRAAQRDGSTPTHLVVGLAPDGGRLTDRGRADIRRAVTLGLNIDAGLHDFLSEDPELSGLAAEKDVTLTDIRRPPPRNRLHFFSGKIEQVDCLTVAVLGTDSAVGKRTTAWWLADAFDAAGYRAEMIGTGQTAWMQGARYCVIIDSLVNDFVAGEIEHVVWSAWNEQHPYVLVIEGQGSLMNPAYPGGFEILAAGRPDAVVLQHAPARSDYDGFPGYRVHPLKQQIQAIELLSGTPVVALAVNHEHIPPERISETCMRLSRETGLPACDVLVDGAGELLQALIPFAEKKQHRR